MNCLNDFKDLINRSRRENVQRSSFQTLRCDNNVPCSGQVSNCMLILDLLYLRHVLILLRYKYLISCIKECGCELLLHCSVYSYIPLMVAVGYSSLKTCHFFFSMKYSNPCTNDKDTCCAVCAKQHTNQSMGGYPVYFAQHFR